MSGQVSVLGPAVAANWGNDSPEYAQLVALIAERDALRWEVERLQERAENIQWALDNTRAIAAALRQQPAPVDLEQFREAVEAFLENASVGMSQCANPASEIERECHEAAAADFDEAQRLLALIDNARKAECATCGGRGWIDDGHEQDDGRMVSAIEDCPECSNQPAPVVDDARMARALEAARCGLAPEHVSAIEEAIAAYNPNCGARTVRAQGVQS